jgi:hypothetical protein
MGSKITMKNRINTLLVILMVINILGDIGNIAFWYASPSSQGSLQGGYIAGVVGVSDALTAGSIILLIVAIIYIVGLVGLLKRVLWTPLLVIGISIVNRAFALMIYLISPEFAFWAVWTIILVVLAVLDYRKLKVAPATAST